MQVSLISKRAERASLKSDLTASLAALTSDARDKHAELARLQEQAIQLRRDGSRKYKELSMMQVWFLVFVYSVSAEGGRERGREGGREKGREGGREGGRERERERGGEGEPIERCASSAPIGQTQQVYARRSRCRDRCTTLPRNIPAFQSFAPYTT